MRTFYKISENVRQINLNIVTHRMDTPTQKKRLLDPRALDAVFATLLAHNPHPRCALNYTNAYTFLVAIILSAQATDKSVNIATPPLFRVADTPEKMVSLGAETLETFIRHIGLFRRKAALIMKMSTALVAHYGGQVPENREALEALPGVGQKSAGVFLNTLFHQPEIPVDTHVFRVAQRLGIAYAKTPEALECALRERIPAKWHAQAALLLVSFGREICRAPTPKCRDCCLKTLCMYAKEHTD